MSKIKSMSMDDIRLLAKGAVCETKQKPELDTYLKGLKISVKHASTKDVCTLIKLKLLQLEQESRAEKNPYRWLYLFNDKQPSITR